MKYTFKFTVHEMELIKRALDNSQQTEEVRKLAYFFERRIKDAHINNTEKYINL